MASAGTHVDVHAEARSGVVLRWSIMVHDAPRRAWPAIALPCLLLTLTGRAFADEFDGLKSSIEGVGDTNGDGVGDLLVATRTSKRAERVWILSGKDGAALRELRLTDMGRPDVRLGRTLAGAGDLTGDGLADVLVAGLVGAARHTSDEGTLTYTPSATLRPWGTSRGIVIAFSGSNGRVIDHWESDKEDAFGFAVAGDAVGTATAGPTWRSAPPCPRRGAAWTCSPERQGFFCTRGGTCPGRPRNPASRWSS